MRTILAIIFMTFATQGGAQTKVSTLDEIEKAAVLYGFCNKIYRQKYAESELEGKFIGISGETL